MSKTELPPGFVGDPQNATQCTAAEFSLPSDTACPRRLGGGLCRREIALGSGSIAGGRLEPVPNGAYQDDSGYTTSNHHRDTPAAFGFDVSGAFFALNATLRSDGDYGVTIGDKRAAGGRAAHGLQALSLTLCGYGVTGATRPCGGQPATAACARRRPAQKPFLTNPTQCTGTAPRTTLRADTYEATGRLTCRRPYTPARA